MATLFEVLRDTIIAMALSWVGVTPKPPPEQPEECAQAITRLCAPR